MNGYFQLITMPTSTGIRVYEPTDGGETLKYDDVKEYLDERKVSYKPAILNEAITEATGEIVVLNDNSCFPERESYKLTISRDRMEASVFFYAPSENAEYMNPQEFLNDLASRNIVYGIDQEAIFAYFSHREYCKEIVIARGTKVREGSNAKIDLQFNANLHAKPAMREDGSVDYFNLNIINHVHKGEELAILTPEDPGDAGSNIYGEVLRPHPVKPKKLVAGKNTYLSDDGLILYADTDGHVTVRDGKVTVSNVIQFENVDVATGNINYDGSVEVKGTVAAGFSIKAGANIHVKGAVEGASLTAGNDIILERGINGTGKGEIKAGGNIVTKFIENAKVSAKGSITSESILHSNVSAGTEIRVSGKKGFIAGGRVTARDKIIAKDLGSDMGATTIIEVGADPSIKVRIRELQKAIYDSTKRLENIRPTVEAVTKRLRSGSRLSAEQTRQAQQLITQNKILTSQIDKNSKELEELQQKLADSKEAYVVVEGTAYPGITIHIGDQQTTIKLESTYCRYELRDGKIKTGPI
ncbi:FapA family protein [Butyrivibrio sp. WCE2006]|uniref:FapA family protein n=1 Tax=Butyrivibrio sp. WCE2006 TaxID=1410611 RepID=UPI0005D14913|nr:FapA family protein [Butyrivibrio sp. WCE2006]